jgi:Protein kinase domain
VPPPVEPLRRWDPEQIGGYVLLGRLGAGAMGQVYLGRSAAGRLVAVKTIKSELAEEPDFRTRFGQEVAAARRVSGAFTAAVVAAESEADVPWLATVYVPAPSLTRLVRSCGPLPVPAVSWLAAGCAEALEAIHGVGLVHRDLKPSNVLVSPDGPRVIDFGVARAAERIQLTVTRGSIGTPAYMAPEQARDTRQATAASDVFSLGATTLFAATGHAPYQGETVMDVLVRLATEPPDLSGLPAELTTIVLACLERDPRNRPTTASIIARLAARGDLDSVPLPATALALIGEYRGGPGLTAASPDESDSAGGSGADPGTEPGASSDVTFGSQPAAAAAASRPRHRSSRRRLLAACAAAAAVALLTAGWSVGNYLTGTPASSSGNGASPGGQTSLGPIIGVPAGGPPGPGRALAASQSGPPTVAISQPTGDSDTSFIVRGQGWPPGKPVTIALVGVGRSPVHPEADLTGAFNYAINQDHEFFRGGLPAGVYTVRVTDAKGASAQARFEVQRF